jgi:thiol-disulfide isomerase/thioredoxin
MINEILLRSLWAFLIAGAGIGVYWVTNQVILARARGKRLGLETIRSGIPAILYFTTPTCAPCKTLQRPALTRLKDRLGDGLQVIEVDASARPDLADYWGVLSVPTTFIIDRRASTAHQSRRRRRGETVQADRRGGSRPDLILAVRNAWQKLQEIASVERGIIAQSLCSVSQFENI